MSDVHHKGSINSSMVCGLCYTARYSLDNNHVNHLPHIDRIQSTSLHQHTEHESMASIHICQTTLLSQLFNL